MKEPKFDTKSFYITDQEIDYVDEKTKELKSIIETIDINLLLNICMEIYKKAVVYKNGEEEYQDFLKYKKRLKYIFENPYAGYSERMDGEGEAGNGIKISTSLLNSGDKFLILRVVFHEFVHSFSTKRSYSGLKFDVKSESSWMSNEVYNALNEAVTELMTDYVLSEYANRSGMKSEYKNFDRDFNLNKTYTFERYATRDVLKKISEESGVTEDVILKSLFGHYIRGDFEEVLKSMSGEERAIFDTVKENSVGIAKVISLFIKRLLKI